MDHPVSDPSDSIQCNLKAQKDRGHAEGSELQLAGVRTFGHGVSVGAPMHSSPGLHVPLAPGSQLLWAYTGVGFGCVAFLPAQKGDHHR